MTCTSAADAVPAVSRATPSVNHPRASQPTFMGPLLPNVCPMEAQSGRPRKDDFSTSQRGAVIPENSTGMIKIGVPWWWSRAPSQPVLQVFQDRGAVVARLEIALEVEHPVLELERTRRRIAAPDSPDLLAHRVPARRIGADPVRHVEDMFTIVQGRMVLDAFGRNAAPVDACDDVRSAQLVGMRRPGGERRLVGWPRVAQPQRFAVDGEVVDEIVADHQPVVGGRPVDIDPEPQLAIVQGDRLLTGKRADEPSNLRFHRAAVAVRIANRSDAIERSVAMTLHGSGLAPLQLREWCAAPVERK